jgi:hypothetical protein
MTTTIEILVIVLAFLGLREIWRFIEERKCEHKLLLNKTTGFYYCRCNHWRYHRFDGRPGGNHAKLAYNEHIKQVGN